MGLLTSIKRLFGGGGRIKRSNELKELLWSVQRDRVPVLVKLANARATDAVFNTYLLKVSPEDGDKALEIDELVPRAGNELAKALGELSLEIDHEGTKARFTVPITRFSGTFKTPMPDVIHIDQQRSTKRMRLSDLGTFPVNIYSDGRKMVRATLTDVSVGGLQLRVRTEEGVAPPFRQGEIIHGIHLPVGGSEIQIHIELRSVVLNRAQRCIILGAKIRGFKDDKHEEAFKHWVTVTNDKMAQKK